MVRVTVNGVCRQYRTPVTYGQIAQDFQKDHSHRIVLAVADNKIRELNKNVTKDVAVTFQTTADRIGHDTYVRSACMLMLKAISDTAGSPREGRASVEFSIGKGYFCMPRGELAERMLYVGKDGKEQMDPAFVERVKSRMRELVREDLPIMKRAWPRDEAIELFEAQGMDDKARLFRYRRGSYVNVYCLDGYYDYNYGYMVPSTGYLEHFDLLPYRDGMMLMLPGRQEPERVRQFEPREKLFQVLERAND